MYKTFGNGRKAGLFANFALLSILLFVPFLLFTACPSESDPAETGKDITGVTLQRKSGSGENAIKTPVSGVSLAIDAENSVVVATVPRGNPIDELYLQLEVSEAAAINPTNEELAKDFMDYRGEKITVTAEDGSASVWTVSAKQDPSPVQNLSVELLGNYQIRFLFAYPNYKEIGDSATEGEYPTAYDSPILLSYFVDDNALKNEDGKAITYYNTLVVSAGGLETREWKIDGKMAPIREGTGDPSSTPSKNTSTTLTIHAQDWTLEDLHTVTLIGTKKDARGNAQKYSGEFTFRVVERSLVAD